MLKGAPSVQMDWLPPFQYADDVDLSDMEDPDVSGGGGIGN